MLQPTRGIVFHTTKYSESSMVVQLYTESFGLQSYIFRGIRKPGSKISPGLLQPLTLLDLVVYHREKHTVQSVKEIHQGNPYRSVLFDIRKSSILLFLNEVLYRSIREEEPNGNLFCFIWDGCIFLDQTNDPVGCFHLLFLLHLTRFLGFFPQLNHSADNPYFNLREGLFQHDVPDHPQYLSPEDSSVFFRLLGTPLRKLSEVKLSSPGRDFILETILIYYKIHLSGFGTIRSHEVLRSVFS